MSDVIVLTPDLPGIHTGGIATYVGHTIKVLEQLGYNYQLIQWDSVKSCRSIDLTCDRLLNMHCWGGMFSNIKANKIINFLYSGELLPVSQSPFKSLLKKIFYSRLLEYLGQSDSNIFISNAALDIICNNGFEPSYDRDIVHYPCIDIGAINIAAKDLCSNTLHLCAIARDVPHKNLIGAVKFAELLSKVSTKKIILHTTGLEYKSNMIEVISYKQLSDEKLSIIYQKSHLNLLFSLDHSKKGFVEGFGLTPLEAAAYKVPSLVLNTGGLAESVHHKQTGYVFDKLDEDNIRDCWGFLLNNYEDIAINSYKHLTESHTLIQYRRFLETVL